VTYVAALACVLGLTVGQVLFKSSANAMNQGGTIFDPAGLTILAVALGVYGVTTLAWVWVLRQAELGQVYPLMALAFVLVPIGSHFIFGEDLPPQYFIGTALMVVGLAIALRSA
jgi:drug/metabolite transporter (DMT)-like permease